MKLTFRSGLAAHTSALQSARTKALQEVGFVWQGKAVLAAPVDTGYLRASIAPAVENEARQHHARHKDATVSYQTPAVGPGTVAVGSNAEYAAAVHEDLDTPRRSGGPKFIEAPFRENERAWIDLIAKRLREAT